MIASGNKYEIFVVGVNQSTTPTERGLMMQSEQTSISNSGNMNKEVRGLSRLNQFFKKSNLFVVGFLLLHVLCFLCDMFNVTVDWLDLFYQTCLECNVFLSVVFGILIIMFLKSEKYQATKLFNIIMTSVNIIMINQIHRNEQLLRIRNWCSAYIAELLVALVFLAVIGGIGYCLFRVAEKKKMRKRDKEGVMSVKPDFKTLPESLASRLQPVGSDQLKQTTTEVRFSQADENAEVPIQTIPDPATDGFTNKTNFKDKWVFGGIYVGFLLLAIVSVIVSITSYDKLHWIFQSDLKAIGSMVGLIIFILSLPLLLFVPARTLFALIHDLRDYVMIFKEKQKTGGVVKVAATILMTIVLMKLDTYLKISAEEVMSRLIENTIVATIVLFFVYIVLSIVAVEAVNSLVHYNEREFLKKIRAIVKSIVHNVIDLCGSLFEDFFALANMIPDYVITLKEYFLGDSSESQK